MDDPVIRQDEIVGVVLALDGFHEVYLLVLYFLELVLEDYLVPQSVEVVVVYDLLVEECASGAAASLHC